MSGKNHIFKLRTPNGWEVELQGDKDYVEDIYGEFKAGAIAVFNREVARTSRDEALDKLLGGSSGSADGVRPLKDTTLELPPANPQGEEPEQIATQTEKRPHRKGGKKSNKPESPLRKAREAKIQEIVKARTFTDYERYTAALNRDGIANRDLTALVVRLAQVNFGGFEEGLTPSEVQLILKERFFINVDPRRIGEAMNRASATFYAPSPADFDSRAKLYKPMRDCIARVNELLGENAGAGSEVASALPAAGSS